MELPTDFRNPGAVLHHLLDHPAALLPQHIFKILNEPALVCQSHLYNVEVEAALEADVVANRLPQLNQEDVADALILVVLVCNYKWPEFKIEQLQEHLVLFQQGNEFIADLNDNVQKHTEVVRVDLVVIIQNSENLLGALLEGFLADWAQGFLANLCLNQFFDIPIHKKLLEAVLELLVLPLQALLHKPDVPAQAVYL